MVGNKATINAGAVKECSPVDFYCLSVVSSGLIRDVINAHWHFDQLTKMHVAQQ
jgi:hypothetical protein